MKKIIILGAGIYQVPLIKKAKEMGLYTIVVSIKGNYPGFSFADKVYYEDTTDFETVLKIAKEEKIDGIITTGTDVAVITIGKVCDELGLPGLSFEAAKIASNKLLMKTKYEEFGVRTARFRKVAFNIESVKRETANLNFPLIFKAVDTSGSRGIIRVDSAEEFEDKMAYTKSATKLDYFIVEEFLEGSEFGAQAFILNGKLQFFLPHGDYVFNGDTGVPIGHYAPYEIDNEVIADAKVQLENAAKAMGLDNCAINADFIFANGKTYVIELGGRCGATCLAELVSIYYDYDYYKKMISVALSKEVSFESNSSIPNASKLLISDRDGKIVDQINNNKENPDVYEVCFDYDVGDEVNKFKVGPHRIGHVITKGTTLSQAIATLDRAINNIEIKVK